MPESTPPAGLGSNEMLGQDPVRAEFEAAAEARGLHTARTTEWAPLGHLTEEDRPYYNSRTSAAWWAWQASKAAERERCAAECRKLAESLREASPLDGSRAAVAQELERRILGA